MQPKSEYHKPILALSAAFLVSIAQGQSPDANYHLAKQIRFDSSAGGVDYLAVDAVNRRLYGAGLKILDIDGDSVVGALPLHSGQGYALAPVIGKGVARLGTIFDLKSLTTIGHVDVRGDGALYEPVTRRAFLFNDTTYVVDIGTARVDTFFRVIGTPEGAAADSAGRVYVNLAAPREVLVIDARSSQEIARWKLQCLQPLGLAIDRQHRRLFVSCLQDLLVLDAQTGQLVARIPMDGAADELAFDSAKELLFVPHTTGKLALIHEDTPDHYSLVADIGTGKTKRVVAVDPVSHRAFLWNRDGTDLVLSIYEP